MKKGILYVLIFLFFLLFFYGKELVYSHFILEDELLTENIILESDYEALKNNHEALLQELELLENVQSDFVVSKIIIRDPYLFFEEATMLKGSAENIQVGDIVMNGNGYIGKVKSVSTHSSQIELLSHPNTNLSVRIQNSYGILRVQNDKLIVSEITSKESLKEGDIVYTSGFTDIPGDIPIGLVRVVENKGVETNLEIAPYVDFENINYVAVRKGVKYDAS